MNTDNVVPFATKIRAIVAPDETMYTFENDSPERFAQRVAKADFKSAACIGLDNNGLLQIVGTDNLSKERMLYLAKELEKEAMGINDLSDAIELMLAAMPDED